MTEITPDITRYEEPPELDDDEVEFWLRHPNGLQEADFKPSLHPRDRLGKWIRTLWRAGPAMVVGGAVRDSLLGKQANDVDLVVVASPEEIKAAVEETGHVAEELRVRDRLVGVRAHGPDLPPGGIEIAPPRIEKSTGPGRKDFEIVPHPGLTMKVEDALAKLGEVTPLTDAFSMGGVEESGWVVKTPEAEIEIHGSETAEGIRVGYIEADPRGTGLGMRVINALAEHARESGKELFFHKVLNERLAKRMEKELGVGLVNYHMTLPGSMLDADAERRDFTVNALYRDPETGEITDPTGKGRADIEARLLRTTHPDSFRDDPLRILRGARFASQHGLSPTPDTFDQMAEHADAMTALTQKGVSGTVEQELNKLLMGDEPGRGLRLLRDTGALAHLIPELGPMIGFDQESRWHAFTVDEHTFRVLDELAKADAPVEVRIAALFHDSGKPESSWRGRDGRLHYYENKAEGKRDHAEIGAEIADSALRRLNYPAETRKRAKKIIENHMLTAAKEPTALKARKIRGRMGDELVRDVLTHRRADIASKGEDDDGLAARIDELADLVHEQRDAPVFISDLKITGSDLIELGIKPGPEIGEILEDLRRQVVGSPERNERDWLLRQAAKAARKQLPEALGTDTWKRERAPSGRMAYESGDGRFRIEWWRGEMDEEGEPEGWLVIDREDPYENPESPDYDPVRQTFDKLGSAKAYAARLRKKLPPAAESDVPRGAPEVFENVVPKAEMRERFNAMKPDDYLWVFHSTDDATADAMLADGIDPETKPGNLARLRYEQGEPAFYQPGAGLSPGLTVAPKVSDTSGFGRRRLAIRVQKKDIEVSPEQQALGATDPLDALLVGDAQVVKVIPPSDIREVTEPGKDPSVIVDVASRLPPAAESDVPRTSADPIKEHFEGWRDPETGLRLSVEVYRTVYPGEGRVSWRDSIQISGKLRDADGKQVGRISRVVYPGEGRVSREVTELDPEYQRRGVATRLAAHEERAWASLGIERVSMVPITDPSKGFAAKHGFTQDANSFAFSRPVRGPKPEFVDEAHRLRDLPGQGPLRMRIHQVMSPEAQKVEGEGMRTVREEMARLRGFSSVEAHDRAQQKVIEKIAGESHVAVRVTPETLKLLQDGGQLISISDPEHPTHEDARTEWESKVWGAHPIYGYLSNDRENVEREAVRGFGTIKLKLKPHVRDRAWVVYSDSNAMRVGEGSAIPSPVNAPRAESVPHTLSIVGIETPVLEHGVVPREVPADAEYPNDNPWPHEDFFEVSIFGAITMDDVEEVIYPDDERPDFSRKLPPAAESDVPQSMISPAARARIEERKEREKDYLASHRALADQIDHPTADPSWVADVRQKADPHWAAAAIEVGLSPAEYRRVAEAHLKKLTAGGRVKIRTKEHAAHRIIEGGAFRNQIQTLRVEGPTHFDPQERKEIEQRVFGTPITAKPHEYAIYGYLAEEGEPGRGPVSGYGDVTWVLKDERVRQRTTTVLGDFLDNYDATRVVPSPIDNPRLESVGRDVGPGPVVDPLTRRAANAITTGDSLFTKTEIYFDAQIHGGVDLKDVDYVVWEEALDAWWDIEKGLVSDEDYEHDPKVERLQRLWEAHEALTGLGITVRGSHTDAGWPVPPKRTVDDTITEWGGKREQWYLDEQGALQKFVDEKKPIKATIGEPRPAFAEAAEQVAYTDGDWKLIDTGDGLCVVVEPDGTRHEGLTLRSVLWRGDWRRADDAVTIPEQ